MARESGVEELRQMYTDLYEPLTVQVKDSAELKRVVVGVVGELRGRVEKLEGSVGEELKARVEMLEGRIEKLQIQGGRCGWVEEGRKKRSGWLTFALFSSSALFCADIALRLLETPGKKVVVDGKAFTS
jgi:hypothetical protein